MGGGEDLFLIHGGGTYEKNTTRDRHNPHDSRCNTLADAVHRCSASTHRDSRHSKMQYTNAVPQHAGHRDSRCKTLPDAIHRCSASTCNTQRFKMQHTSRCSTQMQCPNMQDTEIHDVRHFQMQYTDAVPQHKEIQDARHF